MNYKKFTYAVGILVFLLTALSHTSVAQWSLGVSYEIRHEDPKNGFGVRLEREILNPVPMVNIDLRAHFSYFNDDNQVTSEGISFSQDVTSYDYGLAAIGGVSLGLFTPYIGLGLGASHLDVTRDDLPSGSPFEQDSKDSAFYWNGLIGAKVSFLALEPFVEYHLEDVSNYEDELSDVENSYGRWVFGFSISL